MTVEYMGGLLKGPPRDRFRGRTGTGSGATRGRGQGPHGDRFRGRTGTGSDPWLKSEHDDRE